jgi:hypothetical protein
MSIRQEKPRRLVKDPIQEDEEVETGEILMPIDRELDVNKEINDVNE